MKRALILTDDVIKSIRELEPKIYKQVIGKMLSLIDDPEPQDAIQLKGKDKEFFRADKGEYRIVYRYDSENLYVTLVGKRNDDEVYKKLKRRI